MDPSLLRPMQSEEQLQERRLTAPARSDDCRYFSLGNDEAQIINDFNRLWSRVLKADMIQGK